MERFNYPNIAAVLAEDASILVMLEAESWGKRRDDDEELEEQKREIEEQRMRADADEQQY